MSERDQEILSSVYEAWDRGDFDKAMELAHPEIEYVGPGGQSALKGAAAVRAWMEPDALEDQRVEPFEFRVNGNRVLVRQQNRARGAESRIEIEVETWAVWTLNDDGLVTRAEGFLIHEESEALEAAGLSESRDTARAMSEENVEKIRASLTAWSRGDWDAALKDAVPDMVVDNSTAIGEWRGVHHGAEEIKRMWGLLTEPWERVEIELADVIESRDTRVVTSTQARFYGRDGIELPGPTRSGWIWEFRDGLLARLTVFNDLSEALEAVGLSE